MEEPTAPSAGAKTFGDGFFVDSKDGVTEDVINEWAQAQGYSLSERTDDGCYVFRFNGERHTENEDLTAMDPAVEDDDTESDLVPSTADPVILKGERAKPLEWRKRVIKSENYPVDANDTTFYVPGTDQEIDVEINIYIAADRNSEEHTEFVMKVHQATVTVLDSKNEATHRGHFLTQLQVTASPSPSVQDLVESVIPDVSDVPDESFSKQKSSTTTLNANIGLKGPSGGVGCSSSKGLTSNRRYHSWGVEKNKQQLIWTWQLEHWADGQPFHVDAPGRVRAKQGFMPGTLPVLPELPNPPFRGPRNQAILKPSCEAEWLVRNDKLEGVEKFEWDVEVKFGCASVQVKRKQFITSEVTPVCFALGTFRPIKKVITLKNN